MWCCWLFFTTLKRNCDWWSIPTLKNPQIQIFTTSFNTDENDFKENICTGQMRNPPPKKKGWNVQTICPIMRRLKERRQSRWYSNINLSLSFCHSFLILFYMVVNPLIMFILSMNRIRTTTWREGSKSPEFVSLQGTNPKVVET